MYITMCLYITITILLWVLSIYPFINHYTIVILTKPHNLVIYRAVIRIPIQDTYSIELSL